MPRSIAYAARASPPSLTSAARARVSSPSLRPGNRRMSRSLTTSASTASPRNSSRSLSLRDVSPASFNHDVCVIAVSHSAASRNV